MYKRRDFKDMIEESKPKALNRAEKRSELGMLRDELYYAQKSLNELQKQLMLSQQKTVNEREALCNLVGEILTSDEINEIADIGSESISKASIKKMAALKSQLAKYEEIVASMPELLEYNEKLRVENEYLRNGG